MFISSILIWNGVLFSEVYEIYVFWMFRDSLLSFNQSLILYAGTIVFI